MVDNICYKASIWLSKFDNMPEQDVMKFSLKILLTNFLTIAIILAIGIPTNNLKEILFVAIGFAALRNFTGGYHIKSPEICIVVSSCMVVGLVYAAEVVNYEGLILALNTASLVLVSLLGARNIDRHTLVKKEKHYVFRLIAVFLVIVSFIIGNQFITVSFFMQSLTLIPPIFAKGGE